jgi:hypothetical protein
LFEDAHCGAPVTLRIAVATMSRRARGHHIEEPQKS